MSFRGRCSLTFEGEHFNERTHCFTDGGELSHGSTKYRRIKAANLDRPCSKGGSRPFLLMDGVMKLFKPPFVVQSSLQLGYAESTIVGIGVTLLVCSLLYVIPRTTVLGAIFLTGYLGGAVASNVRAGTPSFNIAFPLLFAVLIWAPLVLRNRLLHSILFKGE